MAFALARVTKLQSVPGRRLFSVSLSVRGAPPDMNQHAEQ